jgi:hypothetical protein
MTSQVMFIRSLLQLDSGTGKLAPTLRRVPAGQHEANIEGDGSAELVAKPFTVEWLPDGKFNLQIHARSAEHLNKLMPQMAAAVGLTEEDLRHQLIGASASEVHQPIDPFEEDLALGGPVAIRSAIKSSLVLWCTLVGNDEIKSDVYAAVRGFILNGDHAFLKSRTHHDSSYFKNVEMMKKAYGPLFNLIYIRSNSLGRVLGHFTLYNMIAWQFVIAEAGGSPNAKIGLISNPLSPEKWSDRAADEFHVPFNWLAKPDYSDDFHRSKARAEAVLQHYFEMSIPRMEARVLEDCRRELGIEPDGIIPRNKQAEFDRLVATRVELHRRGLPHERKLSSQELRADSDQPVSYPHALK